MTQISDELAAFESWWQEHGQYSRAGGGDYEKTFAYNAWNARALLAQQSQEPKAEDAPPFGSKRAAALALYRPPFKFRAGYIYDAGGHMVADQDGFGEGSKVFESVAARVRGWGRIGYLPDAEALQDEVGAVIADALTAYWAAAPQPQQEQP